MSRSDKTWREYTAAREDLEKGIKRHKGSLAALLAEDRAKNAARTAESVAALKRTAAKIAARSRRT